MQKTNILEYLEETTLRLPDKRAIRGGGCSYTFAELKRRAESAGSFLLSNKIHHRSVAVLMDKHPDTLCTFLGVLYAGCFYVCIDTQMPDERIRDIAENAQISAVICNEKSMPRAHILYGRAEIFCFEKMIDFPIDREAIDKTRRASLDIDPAYIVFTSGSTGDAKGVCASHRSLIDYTEALCTSLPFDEKTVFGNQAPLYYDAPLKELLPMMALGAEVCFIPQELFMFPVKLCEFIRDSGINTLCFAASAFSAISAHGALDICDMSFLRTVCFGSEVFVRKEYEKWRYACKNTVFINLYGPTEATGMSCYWIADRELESDEAIPIGKPFKNTEILLINDDGKRCGEGEMGEIYIRGGCVALGYFGNTGATRHAFVQDPLIPFFNDTVYRTGDLAKMNKHGELIYLGRRDRQIKHMGRRIEPCEIESAAERCVGVSQATLIYDNEKSRMILFYTGECEAETLHKNLGLYLPKYMIPRSCIRLEIMPTLPNGKLDRGSLNDKLIAEFKV